MRLRNIRRWWLEREALRLWDEAGEASPRTIHTLFIPEGQSPEQVWEHLSRGQATEAHEATPGTWVNLEIEGLRTEGDRVTGGRLVRVL